MIGRESELQRLQTALASVPVAVIFGVPGVGKSTLALEYASRWVGPVAYLKLGGPTSIAEVADALCRQFGVSHYDVSVSDRERFEDLWVVVEQAHGLAVIDDVHFLPPPVRDLLVNTAAQILGQARLVAVSRELIPWSPGMPDRLQLRLEALDRSSARLLWSRLIELYGPGRDFETAWQRSRGNPFLLRQAHVGTLGEVHPLESAERALEPDEHRLALALALSQTALPVDVLSQLLPSPRIERALHALRTRLIVDLTPDEHYVMHDLLRETILRGVDPTTVRASVADLVGALRTSSLDLPTRVHETARHLRALGEDAELGSLLLASSADLVRLGASATLLQALDTLPPETITTELLVLRARTLARGMQIRRAYQELRRLLDRGIESRHVRFFLASFAAQCGEFDDAYAILRALIGDPQLEPELRLLTKLGLAWHFANRGNTAEAQGALDDPETLAALPRSRSLPLRLYLLLLDPYAEHGADLATEVLGGLRHGPCDLWSRLITPVLCAVILARAGRFEDAEEALSLMGRGLHQPEDCMELAWTRMMIASERGERSVPLAYFRSVQRVMDRGGHFSWAVYSRMLTGKLLLVLGRRSEGRAALEELQLEIRGRHAGGFEALIDAALREDPLSPGWLTRALIVPRSKRGDAVRAAVRAALRHACGGTVECPAGELPRVEIPAGSDYAFDRALYELAHAMVARHQGAVRRAAQHVQRAVAEAAAAGVDDGLIAQLHDAVSASHGNQRPAEPSGVLVIDGELHEIQVGAHRLSLASRAVLRRLIYAFACAPGRHLTRDVIARVLWDTSYDPLRHESSLRSSIRRLRSLLADTGAVLHSEPSGYRLVLPRTAIVIPPLAEGDRGTSD